MHRNDTLDIAKGLGMLFVVLGHMSWSFAFRATYSFHMPLFFLIAGWLLSEKLSPRDYLNRRFRSLMPAYLFTAVCMILLSAVVNTVSGKSGQIPAGMLRVFIRALYGSGLTLNPSLFGIGQIGAIWFLLAMLESTAFVRWLISICRKTAVQVVAVLIIFVISCVTARWIWLPGSIQAGGTASLFVYLGWYARTQEKSGKIRLDMPVQYLALALGTAAWIAAFLLNKGLMVCSASFPFPLVTIPLAILISCGVISLSSLLSRFSLVRHTVGFLGQHSLIVLSFHLMELDYCPWYLLYKAMESGGVSILVQHLTVFVMKILLCSMLTLIALRIPFLRRVFRIAQSSPGSAH